MIIDLRGGGRASCYEHILQDQTIHFSYACNAPAPCWQSKFLCGHTNKIQCIFSFCHDKNNLYDSFNSFQVDPVPSPRYHLPGALDNKHIYVTKLQEGILKQNYFA